MSTVLILVVFVAFEAVMLAVYGGEFIAACFGFCLGTLAAVVTRMAVDR